VRAHDRRWGHCMRVPVRPPPFLQARADGPMGTSSQPRFPACVRVFDYQQAHSQQWEEDKARMLASSRQIGDTIADWSEAALDSIISTVETLNDKLAERRAQREQQQKRLGEAWRKKPPRFA